MYCITVTLLYMWSIINQLCFKLKNSTIHTGVKSTAHLGSQGPPFSCHCQRALLQPCLLPTVFLAWHSPLPWLTTTPESVFSHRPFSACQCRRHEGCGFNPCVRKNPWSRKWPPTAVFLPGKFQGQRSLVGYSPWGGRDSDTAEQLNTHSTQIDIYWLGW